MIQESIVWLNLIIIVLSIVAILTAIGIVWETEKMLDQAFKLFLGGSIAFLFSEIFRYFTVDDGSIMDFLGTVSRFVFAFFFMMGMFMMRRMIQKIEKRDTP